MCLIRDKSKCDPIDGAYESYDCGYKTEFAAGDDYVFIDSDFHISEAFQELL